jgi:protein-S-isoprenylcysteine O-methyltransferase Ste14
MRPKGPKIRVPPLFFVSGFFLGLILESFRRITLADCCEAERAVVWSGWVVAVLSLAFSAWGLLTFQLAGTTWLPFKSASRLVQHGPYRFTRNPMYLGATLTYVGVALVMNVGWPLLLLPFVLWGLLVFVIREEEKYLGATFGADYDAYCKRVRRWI